MHWTTGNSGYIYFLWRHEKNKKNTLVDTIIFDHESKIYLYNENKMTLL